MPTFAGPAYIDQPPLPPRPYGLFDVALGPLPFPNQNPGGGVLYVPDTCEDDVFLVAMNCPPVTGTKTFSTVEAPVSGAPFSVLTTYTCGSIGFSFSEAKTRVMNRMTLREQRAVEQRLWQGSSGVLGSIPGLFANATNLGTAGCPVEAIEILEQALADRAIVGGIIHARSGMSPHLCNNHLVYKGAGRQLTTWLGTPYVFGQGYSGIGPTGQPVDGSTEWMYVTGRVVVWQDPEIHVPDPHQTFDKTGNQMFLVAERFYAVAVECFIGAVQVTRTCTTAGGGT
jgi:hypothetical protein